VTEDGRYVAYWPKGYRGRKFTLQSRNSFIGNYTEEWVRNLLKPFADRLGVYSVRGVVCEEVGLSERSPADVAIVKTPHRQQKPEDILLIVEVKMSIIWNWEYNPETKELACIGDYRTHQGNPGLLRSDTMLKAIGKSINIRVSSGKASKIPIIVIGNTPITKTYYKKVDFLKKSGIIQGFYSVNPKPIDGENGDNIKRTPGEGFLRVDTPKELYNKLDKLLQSGMEFFSSMMPKRELGKLIEMANQEKDYETKAERFLKLIRNVADVP